MTEAVMMKREKKESVLRNPNFLLLFFGGLVSRIGNGVHYIGLVWYILELKGSGFAIGSLLMLSSLPGVILGPVSGVLVDRFDRKKIIIWMDVIRGLIVLAMAALIITQTMNFTYLVIGSVLISICGSLFNPAVSASIPNIVKDEQLTQANSLEHISMNLTGMIGPAFGGILIAIWGVGGVFVLNGISYLISAFSEIFIKFPIQTGQKEIKQINFLKEMKESAVFMYNLKPIFFTMIACLFGNFLYAGCFTVALPLVFRNALQATVQEFGIMEAAWPIGAALGGITLSMLPEFKKVFKIFVGGLTIQTFFFAFIGVAALPFFVSMLGLTLTKYTIISLLIISGIFNALVNIPLFVVFQRMIPDDMRGRAFALLGTVSQGLVPVSIGLTGIVADIIQPAYIFIICAIGVMIVLADYARRKEVQSI